jgi:hypothetical protein
MQFTTNEIEYLGSHEHHTAENVALVDEMWQRLDALRRYDQDFSDNDSRPHVFDDRWNPDRPFRIH